MSKRKIIRSIRGYALHAHSGERPIDYAQLFSNLSELPLSHRNVTVRNEVTVLDSISRTDDVYTLRIMSGEKDSTPTLYDTATGDERVVRTRDSEITAASTILAINTETRAVAIENSRPGVRISTIEQALEILAENLGYDKVHVSLTPLISENFNSALDNFERVRRVDIVLTRPNYNWGDQADFLHELGAASDADSLTTSATARRGESLSLTDGIVDDARSLADNEISGVKDIKILGRKSGDTAESRLSLNKHQKRRQVAIDKNATEEELQASLMRAVLDYAKTLIKKR